MMYSTGAIAGKFDAGQGPTPADETRHVLLAVRAPYCGLAPSRWGGGLRRQPRAPDRIGPACRARAVRHVLHGGHGHVLARHACRDDPRLLLRLDRTVHVDVLARAAHQTSRPRLHLDVDL